MDNTNPKKLRSELKDYLDMAEKEPIRINRRSGVSIIMMNEEKYREFENEISSLQRRLLAMSEIIDGKGVPYEGKEALLKAFKKRHKL